MRFNQPTITLNMDEWNQVLNDREELERLREEVQEHRAAQREYVNWSLNGGMMKAVLAGMQIERESP